MYRMRMVDEGVTPVYETLPLNLRSEPVPVLERANNGHIVSDNPGLDNDLDAIDKLLAS